MKPRPVAALVFLALVPAAAQPIPEAQADQRARALLAQMTLPEKIGQLSQLFYGIGPTPSDPIELVRSGSVGSFLFVTDPATTNRLQHIAVEQSPHHIPLLFGFDVVHGFHTIFPVPLALAASWDPALIRAVQSLAAREAAAVGVRWTFAPMVDIARDPRWGRIVEGAGEDPVLGSAIARAQVQGFQGPYIGAPDHVIACVKHFAGYGAADGGRDYDSSYIPDTLLWNVYLRPFEAAVQAGVGTLMSAYMDLNDVPATGNRFLLDDVLRKTWGFRGFVVSDAFSVRDLATHGFARDPADAALRALTAGVDMDMGSMTFARQLPALVQQNRVSRDRIDEAVRLILIAKIRLGLFEHPFVDEARAPQVFNDPATRRQARLAAARSAVLLRNEHSALPLNPNLASLAVLGPLADSSSDILGSWSFAGASAPAQTILQALRARLPNARIDYAPGVQLRRRFPSMFDALFGIKHPTPWSPAQARTELDRAVSLARAASTVVLVLGEAQEMSGETGSRSSLDLPGDQEKLLEAVAAAGKPTVLVVLAGRPLNLSWASAHIPAILDVWYPGVEGASATADLLFGDAVPGGKLPVTFPRSAGQIPVYYAHNLTHEPETALDFTSRYQDELTSPLYPFGYGLSYTTFSFSHLRLDKPAVPAGSTIIGSVDVANTGSRPGDEVVQIYVHQRSGSASRPVRELKFFERVSLAPGESKTVRFSLGRSDLAYWSSATRSWVNEPSAFDLWAGADSNAPLHATFDVTP